MVGIEIRYRQGNLAVFFYFGRMTIRGGGILVSLPSLWGACEAVFSLLPLEGGARRAEVGSLKGVKGMWGEHFLVSPDRAQARDYFRLPFSVSCVERSA